MAFFNNSISLNEVINLRGTGLIYEPSVLRNSWVGSCQEIIDALTGDDSHEVYLNDGRVVIYRKGYTYPHFIQTKNGLFVCQFWTFNN